ncbi:armadillo-type protein [Gaertneriomyces semiglobifer]|nr:armadillo-type protein [Gaertneriomyces semiglobifer]
MVVEMSDLVTQTVLDTLAKCQQGNPGLRMEGEMKLMEFAKGWPEYPQHLARIAVTPTAPPVPRQLAAITLKNYVESHWSVREEKFIGPVTPDPIKASVRDIVIEGLKDEDRKMRVLVAAIVSRIAHVDFPEAWPSFFDTLLSYIRSANTSHVHGALRVLSEFVRDDLTDTHFPHLAPALLPELRNIFGETKKYSPRDRARALGIFRDFAEIVYMVSSEHPDVIKNLIEPLLPTWLDAFHAVLASTEITADALPVKNEVLRTLCKLTKEFPQPMSPYLRSFLDPIWTHLSTLQAQYLSDRVNPVDDLSEGLHDIDSDGETLGLEPLIYGLLEFVQLVARRKGVRDVFVKDGAKGQEPTEFLGMLVQCAIGYLQVTAEMEEAWMNDVNKFVQDSEEEAMIFNVRVAVEELLGTFVDTYPIATLQSLCHATQHQFEHANALRANGDRNWWKLHEASLLAIGKLGDDLIDAIRAHRIVFDMEGLFNNVVLVDMKSDEAPLLQGRALWFASRFAMILRPELVSQHMGAAVAALGAVGLNPAVKISALKAVRGFCVSVPVDTIKPFQAAMIEGVVALVGDCSDETMQLLIETLAEVVKADEEVTARYEDVLSDVLLKVWARGAEDFLMAEIVTDLFNVIVANPLMKVGLQRRIVPSIRTVLSVENVQSAPAVVATALNFMTLIAKYAPEPFPSEYVTEIFPQVVQILLTSDDHAILQNGLDYIIKIIAKLIDPSVDESAAIFVGDLINKLIQKAGDRLVPVLPQLLSALANRLKDARMPSFIQQLVMVFVHLLNTQPQALVIDFLATMDLDGRSGLEVVVNAWCDTFGDFHGFYNIKASAVAMTKVFAAGDGRVQGLMVKGDEIVTSDRIITRSMTRNRPVQYQSIPFPAKALKLILTELQHQQESRMRAAVPSIGNEDTVDDEDDEGEWDDEPGSSWLEEIANLERTVDMDAEGDDEDPDLINDPIYQMDLKQYLVDFCRTCARENKNGFMDIYARWLTDDEKSQMKGYVS